MSNDIPIRIVILASDDDANTIERMPKVEPNQKNNLNATHTGTTQCSMV